LCGSENKQRLFPYTALTDWLVFYNRNEVCLLHGMDWVLKYNSAWFSSLKDNMQHLPVQRHPVLPCDDGGGKRPLCCQGEGRNILHYRTYFRIILKDKHQIIQSAMQEPTQPLTVWHTMHAGSSSKDSYSYESCRSSSQLPSSVHHISPRAR